MAEGQEWNIPELNHAMAFSQENATALLNLLSGGKATRSEVESLLSLPNVNITELLTEEVVNGLNSLNEEQRQELHQLLGAIRTRASAEVIDSILERNKMAK